MANPSTASSAPECRRCRIDCERVDSCSKCWLRVYARHITAATPSSRCGLTNLAMPSRVDCCLVAVLTLLAGQHATAQGDPRARAADISAWAAAIDRSLPRMRRVVLDLPGASTEGGQLAVYRAGDALRKLVALYYGETGRATECYYVRSDSVRLFIRKEVTYDRPLSGRVVHTMIERVWLVGDSVIQWRDTLGRVLPNGQASQVRGAEVRRDFRNAVGLVGQGHTSQSRISNVRCS
jgi:hypothetical protein